MGKRAECPACKSYSSTILAALSNNKDCPVCGCPYELMDSWNDMLPALDKVKESNAMKEVMQRMEELFHENAKLKTKIHKISELIAWRSLEDLFGPILAVKKLLEADD